MARGRRDLSWCTADQEDGFINATLVARGCFFLLSTYHGGEDEE
jgi:hypothetical protein